MTRSRFTAAVAAVAARWRELNGMRRYGWWITECPICGGRIELTNPQHEQVALRIHQLGCPP